MKTPIEICQAEVEKYERKVAEKPTDYNTSMLKTSRKRLAKEEAKQAEREAKQLAKATPESNQKHADREAKAAATASQAKAILDGARQAREAKEAEKAEAKAAHKADPATKFSASFQGIHLSRGYISAGIKKHPVAGAVATVATSADEKKRTTVTRVAAGATVAGLATGGLGAIAGGLIGGAAKKKRLDSKLYVTVVTGTGKVFSEEADISKMAKAQKFVQAVNTAAQVSTL